MFYYISEVTMNKAKLTLTDKPGIEEGSGG